jgi:hypothetical protein
MVQGIGFMIWWLGFPHDKTLGANLTHSTSYNLGFAWGVSSPLASNAFTIGFGMCFKCKDVLGERGVSKKLRVFSRQAHVLMPGKAP